MTERQLLERLHELLAASAAQFGGSVDQIEAFADVPYLDVFPVGRSGVVAFMGDYVIGAWPDDEQRAASRDGYKLLYDRLQEKGFTRHMVDPRNFRSVKLTRKLGAKPLGYDADGFMHYILTLEAFEARGRTRGYRHGQEVAAA